jgi:hypothetical protein
MTPLDKDVSFPSNTASGEFSPYFWRAQLGYYWQLRAQGKDIEATRRMALIGQCLTN